MLYLDPIITRYIQILTREVLNKEPHCFYTLSPLEGDEMNDKHLLWMLNQIRYVPVSEMSETKKNRWLGYVQGVMISKRYISVEEERNLTRAIFNGK